MEELRLTQDQEVCVQHIKSLTLFVQVIKCEEDLYASSKVDNLN